MRAGKLMRDLGDGVAIPLQDEQALEEERVALATGRASKSARGMAREVVDAEGAGGVLRACRACSWSGRARAMVSERAEQRPAGQAVLFQVARAHDDVARDSLRRKEGGDQRRRMREVAVERHQTVVALGRTPARCRRRWALPMPDLPARWTTRTRGCWAASASSRLAGAVGRAVVHEQEVGIEARAPGSVRTWARRSPSRCRSV